MKQCFGLLLLVFLIASTTGAQTASDAAELTKLLNDFLAGASTNDAAMHDRFWADDLIYTRSAGRRVSKADVMRDVRSAPAPKPSDPKTVFTAEEIRIQQYGNTAIVAFQLVSTTESEYGRQVSRNLNSGTFVKRDNKWQVVNWQSTRMARSEEDSKKELINAENALYRSILGADTKRLATVMDQSFAWTQSDGKQVTRQQLISALAEGRLKYAKLETTKVTYQIAGDTAIVRGELTRQRSAVPDDDADKTPIISFFTMTFVSQGGPWRAITLHTSQE
jgi:ketosteroid isomerase-like protein